MASKCKLPVILADDLTETRKRTKDFVTLFEECERQGMIHPRASSILRPPGLVLIHRIDVEEELGRVSAAASQLADMVERAGRDRRYRSEMLGRYTAWIDRLPEAAT